MDNKTLDELRKHIIQVNDILLKETPTEKKQEPFNKVWVVYRLDETGILGRDTLRTYRNWEDAYKYFYELAQNTLECYKKNNKGLLNGFNEQTYYLDSKYPEFGIDNKKGGGCHIWYEYEECILEESFIL